jgi:hypothetical protein
MLFKHFSLMIILRRSKSEVELGDKAQQDLSKLSLAKSKSLSYSQKKTLNTWMT